MTSTYSTSTMKECWMIILSFQGSLLHLWTSAASASMSCRKDILQLYLGVWKCERTTFVQRCQFGDPKTHTYKQPKNSPEISQQQGTPVHLKKDGNP